MHAVIKVVRIFFFRQLTITRAFLLVIDLFVCIFSLFDAIIDCDAMMISMHFSILLFFSLVLIKIAFKRVQSFEGC